MSRCSEGILRVFDNDVPMAGPVLASLIDSCWLCQPTRRPTMTVRMPLSEPQPIRTPATLIQPLAALGSRSHNRTPLAGIEPLPPSERALSLLLLARVAADGGGSMLTVC